jgi:D-alanyl-D-alanine carboxypeptidase
MPRTRRKFRWLNRKYAENRRHRFDKVRSAELNGLGAQEAKRETHRYDACKRMTSMIARIARRHRPASTVFVAFAVMMAALSSATAGGRPASFVIDGNTGALLSAHNADEPRYPASLTKMMTLYVAFDLMQQGKLQEGTRIRMSARAAAAQPTKLGIEAESDLALIDAIKSLITLSANDVAMAIAEHIAGSEEKFAALMTQKARAIGMKATTFKNASGLPNSEQVTTARDMVTLGMRLQDDFPRYYPLFAMRDFRYAGRNHANHNTLLKSFEGTEGIKTGYTSASGFNLVASVKRGSKHVVGSVFGGASASSRNHTMRTLLQMALFKASAVKTRAPTSGPIIARAKPAPEPRMEVRPPQQVAVALKPSLLPQTVAGANEPQVFPSAAPAPSVEVARVRPVLVAPRAPRQAAVPPQDAAADIATAQHAPQVRVASAGAAAPSGFRPPPLVASSEAARPSPSIAPQQPPMAMGFAPPARGTLPSSLQQQAASLAIAPSQRSSISGGGYEIQIGAYTSAAEAERQLAAAGQKAADLLGSAQRKAQPIVTNGKSLWRARFAGFQSAHAGNVCNELRRRQIDCLVAKAD